MSYNVLHLQFIKVCLLHIQLHLFVEPFCLIMSVSTLTRLHHLNIKPLKSKRSQGCTILHSLEQFLDQYEVVRSDVDRCTDLTGARCNAMLLP